MKKSTLEKILSDIIEEKHKELSKYQLKGQYDKINNFEGNAIGQIGEAFVKEVFKKCKITMENSKQITIHDEYDILLKNKKKIEIKTARKGLKRDNFQFNGINPIYNCDYIILLGITCDEIYYYIVNKKEACQYEHKMQKYFFTINGKRKQIVKMNPGNAVNFKLTLAIKEFKTIDNFVKEIKDLFK